MFLESSCIWAFHVVAMRVDPQVCRRFALTYILCVLAKVTEAQIYTIPASAVQLVSDVEYLFRYMAHKRLCGDDLFTALVVCSG